MSLSLEQMERMAEELFQAESQRREISKFTDRFPGLDVEAAYQIQQLLIEKKMKSSHRIIGRKLGLTSYAKQRMMGVFEPTYGTLLEDMIVEEEQPVVYSELIHPKAEPEIAFVLGNDIEGPAVTGVQVMAATKYVLPALEIIDSRYENFRFTLPDVVADNSSSSRLILGGKVTKISDVNISLLGMVLYKNGQMITTGAGAAVLGHPATAIAWLAKKLYQHGQKLRKGDIVLSGAITGAIDIVHGDRVEAKFESLGSVSVRCVD